MKEIIWCLLLLSLIACLNCGDAASNSSTNYSRNAGIRNTPATANAANTAYNAAANTAIKEAGSNISKAANQNKPQTANANASANPQSQNGQTIPSPTPKAPQSAEKKDESLFSFPPPRVVDFHEIQRGQLTNGNETPTLSTVAQTLADGLQRAGYSEKFRYFWNNDNELGIVTAMEQINADGTPVDVPLRWDDKEVNPPAKTLAEYLKYLIQGKKVYYRVFAFIVTNKEYDFFSNSPPTFNMAKKWMRKGKVNFSGAAASTIREIVFDEQYRCYGLLYLFVNHTSLDHPKPIDDDELKPREKNLAIGLNLNPASHMQQTQLSFAR